jgi:hypothetical protein
MVNNRDGRFEQIALTTSVSSMLLTIIAAMNIWSYFGTFMAEHHTAMMISLVAVVLFSQVTIYGVTDYHHHPYNSKKNTLTIIHILLQSSIEVSIVSPIAAIMTFILWFAIVNSQEPGDNKDTITWIWLGLVLVCIVVFTLTVILQRYDVGISLQ